MRRRFVTRIQSLPWPIRTKLGLAFALVLVCFVLNGVISVYLLLGIKATEDRQRIVEVAIEQVQQYSLAFKSEKDLFSQAIFVYRTPPPPNNFRNVITAAFNTQAATGQDADSIAFSHDFAKLYTVVLGHYVQLAQFLLANNVADAQTEWQKASPDFDTVSTFLANRQKTLEAERTAGVHSLEQTIVVSLVTIGSLTLLSLLIVVGLIWIIGAALVAPVKYLSSSLQKVADGDLEQEISVANRDEIGALAHNLSLAVTALRNVLQGVQVGQDLQNLAQKLSFISKQQLSGAADQVASLIEINATINQLSSTASQIATGAAGVTELIYANYAQIGQVDTAGKLSYERTQHMIAAVEDILADVEDAEQQVIAISACMQELHSHATGISAVVKVLETVASEVHLLALNATIEAAGTTTSGLRFGVVAQEINALAQRARKATVDAQQMLHKVQASSQAAVNRVEQGRRAISSIVTLNAGLRSSLQEVSQSAEEVQATVIPLRQLADTVANEAEAIEVATQQQAEAFAQVKTSAQSVIDIAEQTKMVTRQVTAGSLRLERLTQRLNDVFGQIKVGMVDNPIDDE